jgi:SAM-dependent methyltransferase
MVTVFKRLYRSTITFDDETRKITEFVRHACRRPAEKCRVLDVGCGYGKKLHALQDNGVDVTGVEVNPEIVRANREAGLHCFTAEEFSHRTENYDVMLMSHVIEHFSPKDLIPFLDGYLDRLKFGGNLIIATPLLTPYFYDDFDHVKPYHPMGILMVFGADRAQVQYYARNKLALEDIWIRRSPLRPPHSRGRYMQSIQARPRQILEFLSAVLYRVSGGLIGESDGWVGLFRKVN